MSESISLASQHATGKDYVEASVEADTSLNELVKGDTTAVPIQSPAAGDVVHLDVDRDHGVAKEFGKRNGLFNFSFEPSLPRSHATVDLLMTISCFAAVHFFYLSSLDFTSQRTIALFSAIIAIGAALAAGGLYSTKRLKSLNRELTALLLCWLCAFAAVGLFAFLTKTAGELSRVWITTSMFLSLITLAAVRVLACWNILAINDVKTRNIIVCGDVGNITAVMDDLRKSAGSRVRVARVFQLSSARDGISRSPSSLQRSAEQMIKFVEKQRQSGAAIEEVWVAVSNDQSQVVAELSDMLMNSPVDVCVVPDQFAEQLLKGEVVRYGNTKTVNVSEISLPPAADRFKRVFDVILALAGLIVLCIPMAIIACLVKLESPGPALFRQKRYGIDGKEIEVYKFRSMAVHSDSQVKQAQKNDARITRLGKKLRGSSLDELPQLINVLLGTMSLVGPRPHAVVHNEIWRKQIKGYMLRHKVKPGITGWAQVNGWRGETDTAFKMQQRVKYDLEYIRKWSPWLDIKIIFFTVFKGLGGENAY